MSKESKLNLNAIDYAVSQCDSDKIYNGLEVQKMLCDAYIAGNKDNDKDEEIRKALINVFTTHKDYEMFFGVSVKDILAWLERQGKRNPYSGTSFEYNGHTWGMCARDNGVEITLDSELKAFLSLENSFVYPIHPQPSIESIPTQKPANETSKFHEGDWIVFNGLTLLIEEVVQGYYKTVSIGDIHNSYDWSIDNAARLWTIQDAKDGDVLTCYGTRKGKPIVQTGIFKQYMANNCFLAYIGIDWDGNLKTDFYMGGTDIFPATKGQRNYFFTETSKAEFKA